jgi:hypothetical protein
MLVGLNLDGESTTPEQVLRIMLGLHPGPTSADAAGGWPVVTDLFLLSNTTLIPTALFASAVMACMLVKVVAAAFETPMFASSRARNPYKRAKLYVAVLGGLLLCAAAVAKVYMILVPLDGAV